METSKRKSIIEKCNKFEPGVNADLYIEITEWANEEGWDICIGEHPPFSISYCYLDAINYLTKVLEYEKDLYKH